MNAAKKITRRKQMDKGMQRPLVYSIVLHIVVILLATFGLPYFIQKTEPQEMAITVELADLADFSETLVADKPNESEKPEPVPPKPVEQKPVYKQEEVEPEPPEDLLTPRKPDVEEVPEPEAEKPPEPEKITEVKPPPKPTNKPKPPKPKPPKPKEEKKPEEEKKPPEPEKEFSSLLKSLTPDQEDVKKPVQSPPDDAANQGQTSQLSNVGKTLSRSEEDELNRGVQPCWNVNAGGKYAEELMVSLLVSINPDMSVRDVQVIDQMRYGSDSHFRAAADAARRALLNPTCRTLKLPPEKYESWKVFKYNFDPSMML